MPFDVPVVVAKLPINARDRCVSGHVVRVSNSRLSRMRHRNALNEKAWEHTVQGPGLRARQMQTFVDQQVLKRVTAVLMQS